MIDPREDEENPFRQGRIYPPDTRLCPTRAGMKWLGYDLPVGHPLFSETTPCPRCNAGPHQPRGDHA
jgi:hypothetical protein